MVFSTLLNLSGDRDKRPDAVQKKKKSRRLRSSSSADATNSTDKDEQKPPPLPEFISDESHLLPLDREAPDLRELNNSLEALAAVFPDVQVDVFREMLSSFDGESRLALVANALLQNKGTWVKGRWRVAKKEVRERDGDGNDMDESDVRDRELFRSPEYKKAAKTLAWQEFKGLSKSTITGVLAEFNYSYLDARPTLVELSSKSWSFTLSSLLFRRKPVASPDPETHPLVIWKSSGMGSIVPSLKSTGNPELDRELFNHLIVPLRSRAQVSQLQDDFSLAMSLNTREAEEASSTHDCACCFDSATFEKVASCTADGHIVCFRCVQHSLREAVFGQGWQANVDVHSGTLVCPAVDAAGCRGRIPAHLAQRALLREKNGAEILRQFDQRLAEHSLVASALPLVRCPFCPYAEVDNLYMPADKNRLRLRVDNAHKLLFALVLCAVAVPFSLVAMVMLAIPFLGFVIMVVILEREHARSKNCTCERKNGLTRYLTSEAREALARFHRRRRGPRFTCQAPDCGRVSCMTCGKEWVDVHVCYESELTALRTQVEQAMSMAVKRVCPRCNTSFVKAAGCNKLTCPCGYKMCYVCRADIGGGDVGYQHFCQHFRPHGDPRACTECDKCNLWESEDTDRVLEQARKDVERRWRYSQGNSGLTSAEMAYISTGASGGYELLPRLQTTYWLSGDMLTIQDIFDIVLEKLFA